MQITPIGRIFHLHTPRQGARRARDNLVADMQLTLGKGESRLKQLAIGGACLLASCGGDAVVGPPPEQCHAEAMCDPGDAEVAACPLGAACYQVSMCGSSVICQDEFPEHLCPQEEPAAGDDCSHLPDMHVCTYPSGYDCWQAYVCEPVFPEAGAPSRFRDDGEVCAGSGGP